MKVLELVQGSAPWVAHRAASRNASDAAAVLGCSPYVTRSQLLQARHTGIVAEVAPEQQRRFDRGHEIEAAKRPAAEGVIGEDLFPCVGTDVVDGLELSASFDGLTMLQDTNWECKSLNDELRAVLPNAGPDGNDAARLPKFYRVQMQQQCMVAGCARVLFTASNGEDDDRHCWFYPDDELGREILAGWRQFDQDLAAYQPPEIVTPATAAPVEALPAVSVQMQGSLTVVSNLDVFGAMLRAFVEKIPKKPTTDQEFVDAAAAVKALEKAEEALDAAEANAIGQVQSVEQLTRTIATLREVSATARKATSRLVEDRKKQIRVEEVQRGKDAIAAHIATLNESLGKPYMPPIPADFAAAISGKKTLDSLRNAIDTELARAKISANEVATRILANLNHLRDKAGEFKHLFPDTGAIVLKAPEDLQALVSNRIAEHRAAEQKRLDDERERIREEERARADREAQERAEAERIAAAAAAAPAATTAPAQAEAPSAAATIAAPAAVGNVRPLQRATPAPAVPPSLRLGQINERIAPLSLTADGVRVLGFEPAGRERAAVLYHEADFLPIVRAAIAHLQRVAEQRAAA